MARRLKAKADSQIPPRRPFLRVFLIANPAKDLLAAKSWTVSCGN